MILDQCIWVKLTNPVFYILSGGNLKGGSKTVDLDSTLLTFGEICTANVWHQVSMLTAHKPQQNPTLTYPYGRVVAEAKPLCQKEMSYVWPANQYWDWHLKATIYLR